MDNSRSASPQARPQQRPPSPPANGFDNRAYQHDDTDDPNHNHHPNDSYGAPNGKHEPNGDTKTLEAVNLELINLAPKNGNAQKSKKEVAVDMSASNPYDEYFVPVNEHKKYMRGEKLYVTADKRGEKSGCKRPLCWTIVGLIAAAAVVLIVLASTGLLFSNAPTPVEPYNTTISSARALGGIGAIADHSQHDHDAHDHDTHDHTGHNHDAQDHTGHVHEQVTGNVNTEHGPEETQNDQNVIPVHDNSMYVANTLEGELKVDNHDYSSDLADQNSEAYKDLTSKLSDAIKKALFDKETLESGDQDISVEIIQLKKGSVIVTYRVHWKPKGNADSASDAITSESIMSTLTNYLERNQRMLNRYHIAEEKPALRVLDMCQLNKNNCEFGCEFDEKTLKFKCTCPQGQILDMNNDKKCIVYEPPEHKVLDFGHETELSTSRPITEESNTFKSVHVAHEAGFDWKETSQTAETTTQENHDLTFSHVFGNPTPTADPQPEPSAEPESEPETSQSDTSPDSDYLTPEAEPTAEPSAELAPVSLPEPTAEPEPNSEPTAEPVTEFTAKPSMDPRSESAAEPTAEPPTEPKSEPASEPIAEPSAVSESDPAAEPSVESKSEPTPEPIAEPSVPISDPTETSLIEVKSEPVAEPTANPVAEPTANPAAEPTAEPAAEPIPEPMAEPASEPTADSKFVRVHAHETTFVSTAEPTSEPVVEPTSEPTAEPKSEPAGEPISVSKAETETTSETTSGSSAKPMIDSTVGSLEATPEPQPHDESEARSIPHILEVKPLYENEYSTERLDTIETTADSQHMMHESVNLHGLLLDSKSNSREITTESSEDTTKYIMPETHSDYLEETMKNNHNVITESNKKAETETSVTMLSNDISDTPEESEAYFRELEKSKLAKTTTSTTTTTEVISKMSSTEDNIAILSQEENLHDEKMEPHIGIEEGRNLKTNNDYQFVAENEEIEKVADREVKNSAGQDNVTLADGILGNRSSKAVEETPNNVDTSNDDWLSEHVTEESADATKDMVEEEGESDYLNSNGHITLTDQMPIYGMVHDYNDGDSKRMNEESVSVVETESSFQSTTVSDYIYKSVEKSKHEETNGNSNVSDLDNKPAPVWETEESSEKSKNESYALNRAVEQKVSITEVTKHNTPALNNLNITIYEVSNHNTTTPAPHMGAQSSQYHDHETEMNPFLPEIENNKNLVQKLLEGHDLESINNETQNENVEEQARHNSSVSNHESTTSPASFDIEVKVNNVDSHSEETKTVTTESALNKTLSDHTEDALKDQTSQASSNTNSNAVTETKIEINTDAQELATFLTDTSDLPSRELTTEDSKLRLESTEKSAEDDDEYLSVKPISDDKVNTNNDLSDMPKSSERTISGNES